MKKLKVMSVVGTRPEIIRLSLVLAALDQHCEHVLVHTGQNYDYELNQIFFDDLRVRKPDYFLNSAEGSTGAANTIGNLITSIDKVLGEVLPDAMLVLGDTNSCLSVIPAKRRKVPIFHMEAGNRCFDQRVPEETNRRIVDHTADINLTYSTIARDYLLREGLPPDQIIKTGSPMFEVLHHYLPQIKASDALNRLGLKAENYFVVSAHREENIESDKSFTKLVEVLNSVAEHYKMPVLVSTHPRTQKRVDTTGAQFHPLVRLMKPLGFHDYNKLQKSAKAVLSDSGTITEEASLLNLPAVTLRNAHERPEGMDQGTLIMSGLKKDSVLSAVKVITSQHQPGSRRIPLVPDYEGGPVSLQVVRVVLSYTDYVNRTVWHKG